MEISAPMSVRNFSFLVSLELILNDIVSRSDFTWLSHWFVLNLWLSFSFMQVKLQPTVLPGDTTGCASASDVRFPKVPSSSSGHPHAASVELPCWRVPDVVPGRHSSAWPLGPHDPLFDFCRQSLARCPARPHLKQLIKLMTARALAGGSLSLDKHWLAMWPNLLQIVHLAVFPQASDFSIMERMAPSSSRDTSTACGSKIDSSVLRTMGCIRSLFNPCMKLAFPGWPISPTAPRISSGLHSPSCFP